jgi:NAD(P)H-dependent FMN reductase
VDDRPVRVGIIIGSTRVGRVGPTVAGWFARQAEHRPDVELDVLDLLELDLPPVLSRERHAGVDAYRERLARCDAFVVVTPEYNHGYPAPLKQAIDLVHVEWQAKPVGFVSYGGMAGGLRAVEQLRQVFAEVHVVTVRDCVSLHHPHSWLGDDGEPRDPAGAAAAAKKLLDQLLWWARALRMAREAHPYAA